MQDVVLALLAKEPSHGYDLRRRLGVALGPLGEAVNAGQIYVTLTRLERAGLVVQEREDTPTRGPRRKVYALTAAGLDRVSDWLAEPAGSTPDVAELHLRLVAAAVSGLADPVALVQAQRQEVLRSLAEVQRAVVAYSGETAAWLVLEGVALRMEADLRWLDLCERAWSGHAGELRGELA